MATTSNSSRLPLLSSGTNENFDILNVKLSKLLSILTLFNKSASAGKNYIINKNNVVVSSGEIPQAPTKSSAGKLPNPKKKSGFDFGKVFSFKLKTLDEYLTKMEDDDDEEDAPEGFFDFLLAIPFISIMGFALVVVGGLAAFLIPKLAEGAEVSKPGGLGNMFKGIFDGGAGAEAEEGEGAGASDNAIKAVNQLKGLGYSEEQAIGIVGSLQGESGEELKTTAFTSKEGGQGAHGIVQWRGERITKAEKHLGKKIREASLSEQISYMDYELKTDYPKVYKKIKQATTAEEAAIIHAHEYEIETSIDQRRIRYAKNLRIQRENNKPITVDVAKNYIEFGKRTGDEAHFEELNPEFKKKVYKLAEFYFKSKGRKLYLDSAYRSIQEQIDLPSDKKAIGISPHTKRKAIDLKPADELFLSQQPGLFKNLGLQSGRTFRKSDPGHIQDVSVTKKLVYSKKLQTKAKPVKKRIVANNTKNIINIHETTLYASAPEISIGKLMGVC